MLTAGCTSGAQQTKIVPWQSAWATTSVWSCRTSLAGEPTRQTSNSSRVFTGWGPAPTHNEHYTRCISTLCTLAPQSEEAKPFEIARSIVALRTRKGSQPLALLIPGPLNPSLADAGGDLVPPPRAPSLAEMARQSPPVSLPPESGRKRANAADSGSIPDVWPTLAGFGRSVSPQNRSECRTPKLCANVARVDFGQTLCSNLGPIPSETWPTLAQVRQISARCWLIPRRMWGGDIGRVPKGVTSGCEILTGVSPM